MRRLFLLALPLALMACGSDNETTTGITLASLAGTWHLSTVAGAALPFTISNTGGTKTELLGDTVTVAATGAFAGTQTIRTTVGTGTPTITTLPQAGTISLSGNLVTVALTGSTSASGTLTSATQFSFTDPATGAVFVFVKQ